MHTASFTGYVDLKHLRLCVKFYCFYIAINILQYNRHNNYNIQYNKQHSLYI